MKGDARVIDELNARLAEELTAISQYFVHAEECEDWHYDRLSEAIKKRSIDEMKHAEKLIARILFLEGTPTVSKLNAIKIGEDVPKQFQADLSAEVEAVRNYNEAIHLADKVGDAVTRTMLEGIVHDEDAHIDWLEEQLDQISQMGAAVYLSTQTR